MSTNISMSKDCSSHDGSSRKDHSRYTRVQRIPKTFFAGHERFPDDHNKTPAEWLEEHLILKLHDGEPPGGLRMFSTLDVFEHFPRSSPECRTIRSLMQHVPGVPDIPPRYNPAAWMLDSTTPGMEEKLHVDFADIFKESDLYK